MQDLLPGGRGSVEPADGAVRVPGQHAVGAQGVSVQVDTNDGRKHEMRDLQIEVRSLPRHFKGAVVPPYSQGGLEADQSSLLLVFRRLPVHLPARFHADVHSRGQLGPAGHRLPALQIGNDQVLLHIRVGCAGRFVRQQPAGIHEPPALHNECITFVCKSVFVLSLIFVF